MSKTTAVLAVILFAACSSGDICSQEESVAQSLHGKLAPCETADGGLSVSVWSSCSQSACEQDIASCSAQDKTALQSVVSCEQNLVNQYSGGCNPDALFGLVFGMAACVPDGGISATCQAAVTSAPTCGSDGGV